MSAGLIEEFIAPYARLVEEFIAPYASLSMTRRGLCQSDNDFNLHYSNLINVSGKEEYSYVD